MAYTTNTLTARSGRYTSRRSTVAWCHALVVRAFERIRAYNRGWRDFERLMEAPDHILEDVGLTRAQVRSEVKPRLFG